MRGWQPDEEDWREIRRGFLAGAAGGLVVVLWMWLAHSPDETISSRGFDVSGGGGYMGGLPSQPSGSRMIFAKRDQEGGLASVAPEAVPGGASEPSDETEAAPAPPPAAAPASAAAKRESDPRELAKAGLPTDARGLAGLGARKGLLSAVVEKFLDHPAVLKAVFNNKLVVDAFMSRDISKRNCSDAGALKSYLSDPNSAGMTKVYPVLQTVLSHPDAAAALAGTEMADRITSCPSIKALSSDSSAVTAVAMSNPQAVMLMGDPRLTMAMASNPQASGMLSSMQSSMGGGR